MIPAARGRRRPRRSRRCRRARPAGSVRFAACRDRRWRAPRSPPRSGPRACARSRCTSTPRCRCAPSAAGAGRSRCSCPGLLVGIASPRLRRPARRGRCAGGRGPFRPVVDGRPFLASLTFLALAAGGGHLLAQPARLPPRAPGRGRARARRLGGRSDGGGAASWSRSGSTSLLLPAPRAAGRGGASSSSPQARRSRCPLALRPSPRPRLEPLRRCGSRRATRRGAWSWSGSTGCRRATSTAAGALAPVAGAARPPRRQRHARDPAADRGPAGLDDAHHRPPAARPRHPRARPRTGCSARSREWALLPARHADRRARAFGPGVAAARSLPRRAVAARSGTCSTRSAISSGLVRVWGTHPPEAIRGFVALAVLPPAAAATRARGDTPCTRASCLREVRARAVDAERRRPGAAARAGRAALAGRRRSQDPAAAAPGRGVARTRPHVRAGSRRAAPGVRPVAARRLASTATTSPATLFYRYAHPEAFGNVDPDDARRYGRVLARLRGRR